MREEVTEEEIAEVVARWTKIPLTRLLEGEREKLLRLDQVLHERVIGQDEAVQAVADAVLRARSGIKNPQRPIGSFIFLGPTGVGKTELAKALAEALFDTEENIVRIDMSEYMEKHAVSRMVGSPPGYIGYEEGGQLTEAVRRKPYAVILFDEIEKAHADVFNILLQMIDEGRLTDAHGRTVNFKNTVVIMTSNIGSHLLLEGIDRNGHIADSVRDQIMQALRAHFRPEFLNRVDETVLFKPLTREELGKIAELQLDDLEKRLKENRVSVEISGAVKQYIVSNGYDPVYGARPMKRLIQQKIETPIARTLLAGDRTEGAALTLDLVDGNISVKIAERTKAQPGKDKRSRT